MELEPILAAVPGRDDLTRFEADLGFVRDEKAVTEDEYAKYSDQLEEGDLLIAGWGANFQLDREDEAFVDGAFTRGLQDFLSGEATLAYHHKNDIALGRVLDAIPVDGKGVRVIARVDNQPLSSPIRHLYEQVKKGTLNALSAGGYFKRVMTDKGPRISDVDLTEWSITPVPVGRGCNFSVVAGKALASDLTSRENVKISDVPEDEIRDEDFELIQHAINLLDETFRRINRRGSDGPDTDRTPAVEISA